MKMGWDKEKNMRVLVIKLGSHYPDLGSVIVCLLEWRGWRTPWVPALRLGGITAGELEAEMLIVCRGQ